MTNRYYGEEVTITVSVDTSGDGSADTDLTVARARSATVTLSPEHDEFFAPGEVTRDEVKRREIDVSVEIEAAEFDEQLAQYVLGGDPSSTGTATDLSSADNNVATFEVTVEQPDTEGTDTRKAVVDGVFFEEMPLVDAAEGEFESKDLTGHGNAVEHTVV